MYLHAPYQDRQTERPGAFCLLCGGELYDWETVLILDGDPVCQDCLEDYAKEYFAPNRWVLGDWIRRNKNDHD